MKSNLGTSHNISLNIWTARFELLCKFGCMMYCDLWLLWLTHNLVRSLYPPMDITLWYCVTQPTSLSFGVLVLGLQFPQNLPSVGLETELDSSDSVKSRHPVMSYHMNLIKDSKLTDLSWTIIAQVLINITHYKGGTSSSYSLMQKVFQQGMRLPSTSPWWYHIIENHVQDVPLVKSYIFGML